MTAAEQYEALAQAVFFPVDVVFPIGAALLVFAAVGVCAAIQGFVELRHVLGGHEERVQQFVMRQYRALRGVSA